jgi:alginate O-acetyltransferase complex protein AlgI
MSLSTWFRDYLYIPLGGNRVSVGRQYRNLVTVFFLCGLWHGASWTFVIWGLWHGAFLVVERVIGGSNRGARGMRGAHTVLSTNSASSAVASGITSWPIWPHVYTMLVVMIGWVFFRANTLAGAVAFLRSLAGFTVAAPSPYTVQWYLTPELWLALLAGAIGSTPWVAALASRLSRSKSPRLAWSASLVSATALAAILFASVMQMAARTYNPFIYFRF